LKLLIFTQYFFPISGGVQTIVFELASGLKQWNEDHPGEPPFEVTVVTRTCERTSDEQWPFSLVRCPSVRQLFEMIRQSDVIHVAGPALLPMLIGLLLQKRVIVEHHGYQSICPNGILLFGPDRKACPGHFMSRRYQMCVRCNSKDMGWVGSLLAVALTFPRRLLSKAVSANIAVTNHVARRVALPHTKTVLHGVRDSSGTSLSYSERETQFGYIGRLVQEKGLSLLLNVARRLKDDDFPFHLTLVGDGPLRNQLQEESARLGIQPRVTFTGDLAGSELEQAVRPLKILVMPSLWEETAGLAAMEQMMRGGTVIASDTGGLREVVGDAGLTFTAGDSDALYERLRQVIEIPSLATSLGVEARNRATRLFSRQHMIEAHVSVYRQAFQTQRQQTA
jgi:glycogen synthase